MSKRFGASVAGVLCLVGSAMGQTDTFHVMQIEQVIGGVNGDTSKQAIQLRMRSFFQNQMQNGRLLAYDATGSNPVLIIAFPSPVTNANQGDRVLVTTAAFNSATSPACVPDFTMTNPIPASYLAAGKLCYQDNFGTILWILAWGGAGYTGSMMGSLTNDADGNFGPPFAGPCPTSSTVALLFQGAAADPSVSNITDYALTTGPAIFTSNSRAGFTLGTPPPPCYPNCDGSQTPPILNVLDFSCFLNRFAAGDSYANCDNSTVPPVLNVLDFSCFLNAFAAGCG